jgi:hypothetical protein
MGANVALDEGNRPVGMNDEDQVKAGWSQLTVVLSFFPRIDTKLSVILGLDLGMLTILLTRLPAASDLTWWHGLLFLFCGAPLTLSLVHLYRSAFPDTRGGTDSLVYFGRVAKMTGADFVSAVRRRSNAELSADVFEQVWRNSKILAAKFEAMQKAFRMLLWSILPWLITLAFLAMKAKAGAH